MMSLSVHYNTVNESMLIMLIDINLLTLYELKTNHYKGGITDYASHEDTDPDGLWLEASPLLTISQCIHQSL